MSLDDRARDLAAQRGEFAIEIPDTGLARVFVDHGSDRVVGELYVLLGQAVLVALTRDEVSLGDLASRDLWVQIGYEPSLLGRLRRLLYKLPSVWISVTDEHGGSREFRLLRLVATDGFVLSPLFRDDADWQAYVVRSEVLRPAAFTVSVRAGSERYFEPEIRVRISTIDLSRRRSD